MYYMPVVYKSRETYCFEKVPRYHPRMVARQTELTGEKSDPLIHYTVRQYTGR